MPTPATPLEFQPRWNSKAIVKTRARVQPSSRLRSEGSPLGSRTGIRTPARSPCARCLPDWEREQALVPVAKPVAPAASREEMPADSVAEWVSAPKPAARLLPSRAFRGWPPGARRGQRVLESSGVSWDSRCSASRESPQVAISRRNAIPVPVKQSMKSRIGRAQGPDRWVVTHPCVCRDQGHFVPRACAARSVEAAGRRRVPGVRRPTRPAISLAEARGPRDSARAVRAATRPMIGSRRRVARSLSEANRLDRLA